MYHKTVLPNGLRVVTERIPGLRSVSVGIWVNVGSRDETKEINGIAHFIEHMVFKGTGRRSALDIAKEIDRVGGLSNAFTSRENTCFHAKVLDEHLPRILDLLADIFLHSRFDQAELERERQVILQEINMVEDSPDELVHDLFGRLVFGENPLGFSVLGTKETVSRMTSAGLKDYLHRAYTAEKIVIAGAGNLDHASFVEMVEKEFAEVPPKDGLSARSTPEFQATMALYPRDLEQVHLVLGGPGPAARDERRYAGLLLNVILGGSMSSRLFQEIRERRGLAYSIYSYLSLYEDVGLFGIYAGVAPDKVNETVAIILEQIARLRENHIGEEELAAARDHVKGGLLLSAESSDTRMTRLARNEILFSRYVSYEEAISRIEAVTPEDICQLARDFLTPERLSLVALGPIAEEKLTAFRRI
ncbi:insulinase family protein [Thermosulfuriphilus ammonigenes]|uniref:Insulinase family protein n=1 Tax=Thermosulfuriphilus ammonigenes TaxID=1936021 RepID=A0A6G7PVX5_9BACT|nr:pitrilysin family protein [Thermosulfuriphilus ammonigenes]MBA2848236.1 putative Zn-dependent peptidase [Thermosulfuriphilus ammonigenes]QIJ71598.1 insulinase family protein [Thermosulfuriphilus ammonigenes]